MNILLCFRRGYALLYRFRERSWPSCLCGMMIKVSFGLDAMQPRKAGNRNMSEHTPPRQAVSPNMSEHTPAGQAGTSSMPGLASIISPFRRLARVAETQAQADLQEAQLASLRLEGRARTANLATSCICILDTCQSMSTPDRVDEMAVETDMTDELSWLCLRLMVVCKRGLQRKTDLFEVEETYAEAQAGCAEHDGILVDYLKSIWPEQPDVWPVSSTKEAMKCVA